jgi:drug/metabolite transporter (DMT)-like permease
MYFGFGELAALATAVSWAGSAQAHTMVGRRIGSYRMIVARAPLFFACAALVSLAGGVSTATPAEAVMFFAISAFMGMVVSDQLIYYACVTIGPRLSILIQSLSSCLTALAGYCFLGEIIGLVGTAGILVTTGGVAFVMLEGGVKASSDLAFVSPALKRKGLAAALISAVAMSASFFFLKMGLRTGINPIWTSCLRIALGGGMIWCIALAQGQLCGALRAVWTNWSLMKMLLLAAWISTIGNVLAPLSMAYTETGITATLIGLQPIAMIPITALLDRTIPSVRAVIGTIIAFAGTTLIFLR